MSTQQIRNIIFTQLDPIIDNAKKNAKNEAGKKLKELKKQIPTPQELVKKLSPEINEGTCSEKGKEKFRKNSDIQLAKIERIKNQLNRGIAKLEKTENGLSDIINGGGPIESITKIQKIIEPILRILQIVVAVTPLALAALGGIGTGLVIDTISEKRKNAKGKIGEYVALFAILPAMFANYRNQALSIISIISLGKNQLQQVLIQVEKLEAFQQYLSLQFEQGCLNLYSGLDDTTGTGDLDPNNILNLEQQDILDASANIYEDLLNILQEQNPNIDYSGGKLVKRIYKIGENFSLGQQISYQVINPLLLSNNNPDSTPTDNES